MRRFLLGAACALATAVPAAAQTLHVALRQDLDVLDPTLATTYVGRIVFAGLCDKLFDIDEKLTIVPQLATGYEWADEKTLVIHLRPGVKFHNGEPVDAEAVRYTLNRDLTLQGSFRKSEISSIDHIDVIDPATVRIVLKTPSGAFLAQLTDRSGMPLPPKATEQAGKDFAAHPVCSGPFKFAERVPQDHVTLERFADYWNAKDVHFDKVIYQVFTDSSVRLANLKAGSSDIVEFIAPTDTAAVKADPKLRLAVFDALGNLGITNNLDNGPRADTPYGKNALVRQAFSAAIDRAALVNVVYSDMYAPSVQPVSASSPFYDPSLKPPPRDVAKAKALLKQAGVTLPVKMDLMTPNQPDQLQAAEVIQSMTAEAGFEVHIQAVEFASSLQASARGDYQAYLIGWSGRVDADGNSYAFLRSGQGNNVSHYSNPTVDALLDAARGSTDLAKRKTEYAKVWEQVQQDLPVMYLYNPRNIMAMSVKVKGFRPVPDGMIRLQGLEMSK
ncbi:MAG TPA: ABC transporter substrate-binding protein [Acetobacteraceae bacterium]|jgi:peptide/nickel transport system substrate-binding protein|nr:ABC transporter substrate-binding protein [Acetobacteraceae bacterium]